MASAQWISSIPPPAFVMEALPWQRAEGRGQRAGGLGPPTSRQRRRPVHIMTHCCPACYAGVWEQKHFITLVFKLYFWLCWVFIAARDFLWLRWAAHFLVVVQRLLTAFLVVAHRLSCLEACRIFLDQQSNPGFQHWQADCHWQADGSLPLSHHGSPIFLINFYWYIVALQSCVSFYCTVKWVSYTCVYTYTYTSLFFRHPSHSAYHRLQSLFCYMYTLLILHMCASSLSHIWLFATPWTVACQVPLPTEFSRQEYWSGCHFLLQGIVPIQGWNPHLFTSPALAGRFFTTV